MGTSSWWARIILTGRASVFYDNRMMRWPFTRRSRPDLQFVMFTRHGCHLCDDAWELLSRYQARHGFALEAKDVDATPEWVQAHGDCVPVVLVNGKVRFRGKVNEVLLRRILAAGANHEAG
jgi:hypothetical protein